MTTRRWLKATAVIALSLAAARCMNRRAYYLQMAGRYAPLEHLYSLRSNVNLEEGGLVLNEDWFENDGTMKKPYAAAFARKHEYFAALVRKYRRAATRPWSYVEHDSPEPR